MSCRQIGEILMEVSGDEAWGLDLKVRFGSVRLFIYMADQGEELSSSVLLLVGCPSSPIACLLNTSTVESLLNVQANTRTGQVLSFALVASLRCANGLMRVSVYGTRLTD